MAVDRLQVELKLEALSKSSINKVPPSPFPDFPEELESVIVELAKNGVPYFQWPALQELLTVKMIKVLDKFYSEVSYTPGPDAFDFEKRKTLMVYALRSFNEAPFTIQRLAEILLEPNRQYRATHKLMNGIEKLLAVSTTVPRAAAPTSLAAAAAAAAAAESRQQGAGEASQEQGPPPPPPLAPAAATPGVTEEGGGPAGGVGGQAPAAMEVDEQGAGGGGEGGAPPPPPPPPPGNGVSSMEG